MDDPTFILLSNEPPAAPTTTVSPSSLTHPPPGLWWQPTAGFSLIIFLLIVLSVFLFCALMWARGTARIDSRGNWLYWESHDRRYRRRLLEEQRRRRLQYYSGVETTIRTRRPSFMVFNLNFLNWRPSLPRVRLSSLSRRRNQGLPSSQPSLRQDTSFVPLDAHSGMPARPQQALVLDEDVVRRNGIVTGELARLGVV